jgi:hypothetical protein
MKGLKASVAPHPGPTVNVTVQEVFVPGFGHVDADLQGPLQAQDGILGPPGGPPVLLQGLSDPGLFREGPKVNDHGDRPIKEQYILIKLEIK